MTGGIWWALSPPDRPSRSWRCPMPWYWTDELARALLADGRIEPDVAVRLTAVLVAVRRDETTVESAASALADDDELPLAA